jgi:hypothetical protein
MPDLEPLDENKGKSRDIKYLSLVPPLLAFFFSSLEFCRVKRIGLHLNICGLPYPDSPYLALIKLHELLKHALSPLIFPTTQQYWNRDMVRCKHTL